MGKTFSKAWRPDIGFVYSRWDHYSELMMLYLLAIGSPTHPIAPDHWNNFTRPKVEFGPYTYISGHDPLFVHQFSHAWFDFAHRRDAYADYFANSIIATRAHKAFCLSLIAATQKTSGASPPPTGNTATQHGEAHHSSAQSTDR